MMQKILDSYEQFISGMSSKSKTFAFWNMYIKIAGSYCVGYDTLWDMMGYMILSVLSGTTLTVRNS